MILIGNYSRLAIEFLYKRSVGFYIVQTYIPAMVIVSISWLSFWINHEAMVARMIINIMSIMMLMTLMVSTNTTLPKVSYIKALDMYMFPCFLMVIMSLLGE